MEGVELWNNFLSIIESKVKVETYLTWFKPLKLLSIDKLKNEIIIQVPMAVHKNIIEKTWYELVEESLFESYNIKFNIKFVLPDELNNQELNKEIDNNLEDTKEFNIVSEKKNFITNLKEKYTFENFVTGDTNNFAKTSAIAVASQPGLVYNPLFIYGKSGLGKTHLLHAIGNYITQNSDLKVLYTTSENFKDDYTSIAASGDNTFERAQYFKNKYRDVDVLLVDDIQFLVGAEKTQQGFFNTFNELHSNNKQIIITSDRSPEDLKILEERLRSRFTWGLPVDIYPPDLDLRCRILKNKLTYLKLIDLVNDDVIDFIANSCDTDVREIEGAINRLQAYMAVCGTTKVDLEFAMEALGDYVHKNMYSTSDISVIQKAVADYYGITVEVLKGKKKSKNIAYPRMLAMYLSRMLTDESFPRIGLEFGGKDHSTIIHACDKISNDLKENKQLQEIINEIKSKI